LTVCTAAYLLSQPVAGMLADRWEIRTTVLAGLLLAAVTVLTVTFTSGAMLIGVVVLAGIGVGAVWTNSDALVAALAEPANLGASVGAAQSFKEFGDMVGPLLVGALTQFFGVRTGFVTCGALALLFVIPLIRSPSLRA
jgi:DHA1 family multidrug resistance protein-like MFS transporter